MTFIIGPSRRKKSITIKAHQMDQSLAFVDCAVATMINSLWNLATTTS